MMGAAKEPPQIGRMPHRRARQHREQRALQRMKETPERPNRSTGSHRRAGQLATFVHVGLRKGKTGEEAMEAPTAQDGNRGEEGALEGFMGTLASLVGEKLLGDDGWLQRGVQTHRREVGAEAVAWGGGRV